MKTLKVIFFDLGETLVTKDKQLITGVKEMLDALHQKGIRLGIISNTGNLTRAEVVKMLPADFDFSIFEEKLIVLSSEVGVEKPDLQIFRLALAKTGITAEECLFCTEDLVHTLVGQQIGFKTARVLPPPTSDIADLSKSLLKAQLLV